MAQVWHAAKAVIECSHNLPWEFDLVLRVVRKCDITGIVWPLKNRVDRSINCDNKNQRRAQRLAGSHPTMATSTIADSIAELFSGRGPILNRMSRMR